MIVTSLTALDKLIALREQVVPQILAASATPGLGPDGAPVLAPPDRKAVASIRKKVVALNERSRAQPAPDKTAAAIMKIVRSSLAPLPHVDVASPPAPSSASGD